MEFFLRQLDNQNTEISCRYFLPSGESKIRAQLIHKYSLPQDPNAYADLVAVVQETLAKSAKEEIREFVRQHQRREDVMPYPTCFAGTINGTNTLETNLCGDQRNIPYWKSYWDEGTSTATNIVNTYPYVSDFPYYPRAIEFVEIKWKDGSRTLSIKKESTKTITITPEDIEKAKIAWWKDAKINIIARKAETKAEELLKMFISEVDFRNYREKGFFTVASGKRIFRIYRDTHKHIDMFEKEGEVFVPKNRLCVHTPTRELPLADEALAKLLLIRNNTVVERSNLHDVSGLSPVREMEELLV